MKPTTTYTRNKLSIFLFSAALMAVAATATPAFAGLQEGLAAYDHEDWSTARTELMPLAEKGNSKAMGRIGSLYRDGKGGVAQDYTEAMRWYRAAADKGDAYAQNNLGAMYQNEMGVPADYKEAIALYRKSAKQGNALAKENLANMLEWEKKPHGRGDFQAIRTQSAQPTQSDADKNEEIRAYGCATSNYDCKTTWSGGKY